jgi:hypothetical protein
MAGRATTEQATITKLLRAGPAERLAFDFSVGAALDAAREASSLLHGVSAEG